MSYCGYVVRLKDFRAHGNADRMRVVTVFGNDVCVDLTFKEGDLCLYFPTDGQLSPEYCAANHLCRKTLDGQPDIGYMDPDKRNVKTIKLRGEYSDGLVVPISSLDSFGDISTLKEGDVITVFNGHEICRKYIPRSQKQGFGSVGAGNRTRKKKMPIAPLFVEHADTEQLAYNLHAFKPGDQVEITLKMHGTSQRTGYLPVFQGYKRTLWDKIRRREGAPIYDWGYVTGTRRVVLDTFDGGFYGSNEFREQHAKKFEGKLHKGEEVYYEVVGFTHTGAPIMGSQSNKKMDKDFQKQYGDMTVFSYGCSPDGLGEPIDYWDNEKTQPATCYTVPQSEIYVYRMTMTNEDGYIVEYTPDFMRYRCEQMGVKCVPVLWKGNIPDSINGEIIMNNFTPGDYIKPLSRNSLSTLTIF